MPRVSQIRRTVNLVTFFQCSTASTHTAPTTVSQGVLAANLKASAARFGSTADELSWARQYRIDHLFA